MATLEAPRYVDAEYQEAHDEMYAHPLRKLETVLPPGVSREEFDSALGELVQALGKNAVFTGDGLAEYVDPYEIPESDHERKVPSAAAW